MKCDNRKFKKECQTAVETVFATKGGIVPLRTDCYEVHVRVVALVWALVTQELATAQ